MGAFPCTRTLFQYHLHTLSVPFYICEIALSFTPGRLDIELLLQLDRQLAVLLLLLRFGITAGFHLQLERQLCQAHSIYALGERIEECCPVQKSFTLIALGGPRGIHSFRSYFARIKSSSALCAISVHWFARVSLK